MPKVLFIPAQKSIACLVRVSLAVAYLGPSSRGLYRQADTADKGQPPIEEKIWIIGRAENPAGQFE